jgi:uncharacterized protein (TIGR03067 family)
MVAESRAACYACSDTRRAFVVGAIRRSSVKARQLVALIVVLGLPLALRSAEDAGKELDHLQGSWSLVAAEEAGKNQTELKGRNFSVVVKGDVWSIKYEGQSKSLDMKLELDPSSKPKAVNFISTLRDNVRAHGIYELEGDTLKVCWAKAGHTRPSEFKTCAGDKCILLTLKRVKTSQ